MLLVAAAISHPIPSHACICHVFFPTRFLPLLQPALFVPRPRLALNTDWSPATLPVGRPINHVCRSTTPLCCHLFDGTEFLGDRHKGKVICRSVPCLTLVSKKSPGWPRTKGGEGFKSGFSRHRGTRRATSEAGGPGTGWFTGFACDFCDVAREEWLAWAGWTYGTCLWHSPSWV